MGHPMTLEARNRMILWGFLLLYAGAMGTLAALSFEDSGSLAIRFVLLPVAFVGGLIIVAKLSGVSRLPGK
jgi:hypothetical protein